MVLWPGRVQHPALAGVSKGFFCQLRSGELCNARCCLQTAEQTPARETQGSFQVAINVICDGKRMEYLLLHHH